jgi:hypothetical protein
LISFLQHFQFSVFWPCLRAGNTTGWCLRTHRYELRGLQANQRIGGVRPNPRPGARLNLWRRCVFSHTRRVSRALKPDASKLRLRANMFDQNRGCCDKR